MAPQQGPTQSRTIELRGVLIPSTEELQSRLWVITCDVLAYPVGVSKNFRYPRAKYFYGYVQFLLAGRVIRSEPLEYLNQLILWEERSFNQLAASLKCMQKDLNESIKNLGVALGLSYSYSPGYQHSWFPFLYDRILFKIEPGWIIQVESRTRLLERCDDDDAPPADRPGLPTPPAPEQGGRPGQNGIPPVTAPYDPTTDDNGDTYDPTPPVIPPEDLPPGKYKIKLTYLDRQGGAPYDPAVPRVTYDVEQGLGQPGSTLQNFSIAGDLTFSFPGGSWRNGIRVTYTYTTGEGTYTQNVTGFISGEDELIDYQFLPVE